MTPSSRLQVLHVFLLVFIVATTVLPLRASFAQTEASALFGEGSAAFGRGDFETALRFFRQARAAGTTGPAVDYNIAVCEYRLGQLDEAERSFLQLGADYPAMADLATYNVGLVLLARGETSAARQRFEDVRTATDPALRDLAITALARTAPPVQPVRRGWFSYLEFNGGYDSNVALIEDSVLPAGSENGSDFLEAIGFARRTAGTDGKWRVDLTGYAVRYADTPEYDQVGIGAVGLRGFALDAWTLRVGPVISASQLDGDGFDRRAGVQMVAERGLAGNGSLRLRAENADVDALDERFDYVEGDRRVIDATWVTAIGGSRLYLSFGLESNDRLGASVSPERERASIVYRRALAANWTLDAGVLLRDSDYDGLAVPRSEKLRELSAVARRPIGPNWELNAAARFSDNASSDPVFDYSRTRVSVGVNRLF